MSPVKEFKITYPILIAVYSYHFTGYRLQVNNILARALTLAPAAYSDYLPHLPEDPDEAFAFFPMIADAAIRQS